MSTRRAFSNNSYTEDDIENDISFLANVRSKWQENPNSKSAQDNYIIFVRNLKQDPEYWQIIVKEWRRIILPSIITENSTIKWGGGGNNDNNKRNGTSGNGTTTNSSSTKSMRLNQVKKSNLKKTGEDCDYKSECKSNDCNTLNGTCV